MRRWTTFALLVGGTLAVVTAAAVARSRIQGRETPASSEEDLQFMQFAPGGSQGFWFNGPIGRAFAKFQPISHAGLYEAFWEAEYESSADIEARFAAAQKDPEFEAALNANFSHCVDGESRDYVLSEVVEATPR